MLARSLSRLRLKVIIFLVFTLISCIPVFFLAYWVSQSAYEREIATVEEKHLIIAGNISRAFERYARDATSVFRAVSDRLNAGESVIESSDLLRGIDISDLCILNNKDKLIGALNFAGACDFTLAPGQLAELKQQSRKDVDISGLAYIWRLEDRPVLLLSRWLLHDNLAIATLELDYLIAIQKSIAFGVRGHSMVTDAAGRVIAHPDSEWESISKDASRLSVVQKMMAGETGVSTFYSPPMQADMIAGHTSVPGIGWGVMVPQPLEELEAEVTKVKEVAWMISLLGVLVAALLSWLAARALANPIEQVARIARIISRGHRSARIPDNFPGFVSEIGELGIYFNHMIQHMRDNHRDLEQHRSNLEGLVKDRTNELMREMQERQKAEKVVQQEKDRLDITLASIGDGVITTDANYRVDYLNPVAEEMTGWSLNEAKGIHLSKVVSFIDALTSDIVSLEPEPSGTINKRYEGLLIRRDGDTVDVQKTVARIMDHHGQLDGLVLVMRDVTENRKLALKLSYEASHDPLTGLFNRRAFEEKAANALVSAQNSNRHHVLCYLDLDQFKIVNDTCGHNAGDEMLRQLGELMRQSMRNSDVLARLGGDEFGIIFFDCSLESAHRIASNICKDVQEFRFSFDDYRFRVGVSIGLTKVDSESKSLGTLLNEADSACYLAKDRGRNRIETWQASDAGNVERATELQWVNRINTALDENRFELYVQAIVPLSNDHQDRLYELLIRLKDDAGEITLPGSFMPAAARFKLLPKVDRWVLATTFAWLRDTCPELNGSRISINITGETLSDPDFLPYVKGLFEEYEVDGKALIIEITENSALNNLQAALAFMNELTALGCQFSLDDFGTGFSSLGNLKQLPVNYIKIDGNFVRDMTTDPTDEVMVRSICQIGQSLDKIVVAEFVEDADIENLVREIGVDYAQGYHIDSPSPLTGFSELQEKIHTRIA